MAWFWFMEWLILVYKINRIIHGRLEIWNLSSRVHIRYLTPAFAALTRSISMWTLEDKFHISARPCIILYLLYTYSEKYSPKSYVVNCRTQISSSQSEERAMVFTREKNDTFNRNRERCFFTCEKNDTSNQKPQRWVSFAPKFPPFIAACSTASHTFKEKSFTQRVLFAKKVENISEMEWNSFVCFTVDKENGRESAKQQRKGKNRTRRKLLLCFLSELLCLSFKLKLILKPAILLKFTHF